jgi:hypothetical protein
MEKCRNVAEDNSFEIETGKAIPAPGEASTLAGLNSQIIGAVYVRGESLLQFII